MNIAALPLLLLNVIISPGLGYGFKGANCQNASRNCLVPLR